MINFVREEIQRDFKIGSDKVDPRLSALLLQLSLEFNFDMVVTCGYRTPEHNAEIGGHPNSCHCMRPLAAYDIADTPALRENLHRIKRYVEFWFGDVFDIVDEGDHIHIEVDPPHHKPFQRRVEENG